MAKKTNIADLLAALLELLVEYRERLPPAFPDYMNTKQAAMYLGVSVQWLEITRHRHRQGPPFIALGGRGSPIRYKKTDLDTWTAERCRTCTTESYGQEA